MLHPDPAQQPPPRQKPRPAQPDPDPAEWTAPPVDPQQSLPPRRAPPHPGPRPDRAPQQKESPATPPPKVRIRTQGGSRPAAQPEQMLPLSEDDVLTCVLARELENPASAEKPGDACSIDDPNIAILDEVARGISHGSDLNHVKNDVVRVASNQPEKIDVVKSILRAIDLNRVNDFVQVRAVAEKALKRAALRGDLRSHEHLAFMRYSNEEVAKIIHGLSEGEGTVGIDSVAIIEKVDYAQHQRDAEIDKRYRDTTPQGREMIRKQIFVFKQRLQEAGKLKANPDGIH